VGRIDQLTKGNRLNRKSGGPCRRWPRPPAYSVVSRVRRTPPIGTEMHESPQVPNYWPGTPGPTLKEACLRIEPMVNVGGYETYVLDDGWGVMTQDGKLSAHFEHTIAVDDDGPEVFTA